VTTARPAREPDVPVAGACACCSPGGAREAELGMPAARDAGWRRAARLVRWLSWASLAWMCTEGAVGLWQGLASGSIALTGWALGSAVEGLASVMVIWRFTGASTLSETAERRAQRAVAVSFWLLAPYIAAESVRDLVTGHHAGTTVIGIALTAVALAVMPLLGWATHKLAARLGSAATAGEGTQNYLCAAQAAALLAGLAVTAAWPGCWWTDPVIGLGIAAFSVREGIGSWRGDDCC
jgi:divalent metal cation (Fe/Co/Zn/Cd) transporter